MFMSCSRFNGVLPSDAAVLTTMGNFLNNCHDFAQTLAGWDVSTVTNMDYALQDTWAYNEDLTAWNVSNVTNCTDFRKGSALSCANTPALSSACTGC